jgi:UDP:flavonoid glycosyltransferase YjiC (YdhE family)
MDQSFFRPSLAAYAIIRRSQPDLPRRVHWPFGGAEGRPPTPILMAISPHVFPPPPDWPARNHVTGYWFLDESPGWEPPAALVRFLEDGPAPVCIGFGSVVTSDAARLGRVALEALARSGLRGVLLGGWSGIGGDEDISGHVLRLESAPHGWLFPRMAAVVHHGGAGTTAAGLRAGAPGILTPFSSDQPFWASRIEALGVGPRPIPIHRLTADNLAEAMRLAVSDESIRARAADLGAKIRAEDGVARAVEIIEGHVAP